MKKFTVVCLFVCCVLCNFLVAQQLRHSDIRISLLTADPGEEIYAVFGHSAIRVKIDSLDHDVVYNYGTFSFDQPNFVANFARGEMLYYLSVSSYNSFFRSYAYENRGMREQVFALDSTQTMFMYEFLQNNYKPENRYYLYHFFLDNCATRIRDLMIIVKNEELREKSEECMPLSSLHSSLFTLHSSHFTQSLTYRELIHRYLKQHPWGRFGIDIALGLPTDQKTGIFEQMFLPDYLFDAFDRVEHDGRPIVKETKVIFTPDLDRPSAISPPGSISPTVVCCLILALAAFFLSPFRAFAPFARVFDVMLFFVVGLTGLLITFLWFFTEHTFTQNNLNIIWALPTHAVMAFFLLQKRRSDYVRKYFLATAIIAMFLIMAWLFLPQRLNPSLIPLVLAIALRAFRNSRFKIYQ